MQQSSSQLRIELVQPPKYFVENVKALLESVFDKLEDPSELYSKLYDSAQTRKPKKLEELSLSVVEKSHDSAVKPSPMTVGEKWCEDCFKGGRPPCYNKHSPE